jgi:hypothetical protein
LQVSLKTRLQSAAAGCVAKTIPSRKPNHPPISIAVSALSGIVARSNGQDYELAVEQNSMLVEFGTDLRKPPIAMCAGPLQQRYYAHASPFRTNFSFGACLVVMVF